MALIFENQQLSYAELNARANQLARLLITKGIEGENTVALLMDRSTELMISILAILKAGGAYVPLDPKYPGERLKMIFCDAAPKLLLLSGNYREALKYGVDVPVLYIETLSAELESVDSHNLNIPLRSSHLAYVLYTSGSTGIPKGVMIEHGSVVNLVYALQTQIFDHFNKQPRRVALNTAITFDASVQQWTRLLLGDCIVMLSKQVSRDSKAFAAALKTNHVEVLGCTPTQLRLLFEEGLFSDESGCPVIVLCGGEAIDTELWQRAVAYKECHFFNVYGPTECTVDATCCLLEAETPHIGRPLANVQTYILNRNRKPVPIGIAGELHIGGVQLARGYLNRLELTAERFIKNPYSNDSVARLYSTGDLARYLPNGNIEYLGRIDFQIKLRGYRIELGEIESLLRQHASVKDAVVILREDRPGDQRLAAYVIPSNNGVNTCELKSMLKAKLPEYMVPADIVLMQVLPLTINGKIDRKALLAPSATLTDGARLKSRSTLELHLIKIWEDLLKRKPIGIQDNFFDLGGHSLLAVQLFNLIEIHFGQKLPLDTLWFDGATIEVLARILTQEQKTVLWPELVQIKTGGGLTPLFCIHTLGGHLFHYYEMARVLPPQLPVYGLQARGVYCNQSSRDNIADIASDCINAMRQLQVHGPYRIAGFSSGGIVAFEMAQQLHAAGEEVSCLALLDSFAPGVRLKRNFWKGLYKILTFQDLRGYQERIYYLFCIRSDFAACVR